MSSTDKERALRDKMMVSLEKGRNSLRPLTELAYQYKDKFFLGELRKIDNEFQYLIDKIRSSPSGVDRKQVKEATKFDSLYVDSCELVSDQISNLYGKLLDSKLDFKTFLPELFYMRKIVVDLQNTYGGRVNALNQANLTLYSIQKKLNKKDMRALGETIKDLQDLAEANDAIAQRIASAVTKNFQAIDAEMQNLQSASESSEPVKKAVSMWNRLKIKKPSSKTLVITALGIATLLAPLALPGIAIAPVAFKAIDKIVSTFTK